MTSFGDGAGDGARNGPEALALERVIQRVSERFPQVSTNDIAELVHHEYELYEASKIRDFIPVLIERSTRDALSRISASRADGADVG